METAPLTGMGHGAAGYAAALYRLGKLTKDKRFQEAAMEAVAYENQLFDAERKNWPDLRKQPSEKAAQKTPFMVGWCSGAPGVGHARIPLLTSETSNNGMMSIQQDIENAVQFTQGFPMEYSDHVCCGHAGRLDFLMESALIMDRPDWLEEAKNKAGMIIARRRENGHYLLNGSDEGAIFNPSFFQGISGIGYFLLRCIAPNEIKSLLY